MRGQEKALEPGEAILIGVDPHKEICRPCSPLISFSRQKEKGNHSEEFSTEPLKAAPNMAGVHRIARCLCGL